MLRRLSTVLVTFAMLLSAPLAIQAAPITFAADLTGAAEDPPNASPGSGEVTVIFDLATHTLRVIASFEGLVAPTTASHIHCCTINPFAGVAGVATMTPSFVGFPLGVTSGAFDQTYDTSLASTFNTAFINNFGGGSVAGAELALLNAMLEGRSYFNIHTAAFPGGEIRGFLQKVPEPGILALLTLGLMNLRLVRRRTA